MCRGRNVEEKDYMEKVTWMTDTRGASHVEEKDYGESYVDDRQ